MTRSKLLETLLVSIGSAFVGSAATIWVAGLEFRVKDRELDIRMVDVALTILSAKDTGTKSHFAKDYALRILDKYTGVNIDDAQRAQWVADDGELPIGRWPAIANNKTLQSWWNSDPNNILTWPDMSAVKDMRTGEIDWAKVFEEAAKEQQKADEKKEPTPP